jgi:HK97 family phage major capsid protein
MKSKDLLKQEKDTILQNMNGALRSGDEEKFAQAFTAFAENLQESILADARETLTQQDQAVLTARGVRQLTQEERTYYSQVIQAMRTSDPRQALTNLEVAMPRTVLDSVFEDLTEAHPLLEVIDFQNTTGLVEAIVNTGSRQLAVWGDLTATIVQELTAGLKKVPMTHQKLSAFIPVAQAMLDLGPDWLDLYVRTLLQEAIYLGLEEGILNGTGKSGPIGMKKQVGDGVTVTSGVYPDKTKVKLTSLDNDGEYYSIVAGLLKTPDGKYRTAEQVIFVCNPVDYVTKVMPATTARGVDGTLIHGVFPFPTLVIPSVQMQEGEAIVGLPKRYFMGIGTAKSGKIEYSDEYKFLEDERMYKVKLYGHGEPKDNTAFAYLDISSLQAYVPSVKVKGTVTTEAGS